MNQYLLLQKNTLCRWVTAGLMVFIVTSANSSLAFINIESLRQNSQLGLHGSTGVKASGASGNVDVFRSELTSNTILKNARHESIAIFSYTYGEAADARNNHQGSSHLRYAHRVKESDWHGETYVQAEFNEFQDLTLRTLVGAGARYKIYAQEGFSLYSGAGAFQEFEDLDGSQDQEALRGNIYLSIKKDTADKRFSSSMILYYQPNTKVMSDHRLRLIVGAEFKLTETLLIQLNYTYFRDTLPPPGIAVEDSTYMTGLTWRY